MPVLGSILGGILNSRHCEATHASISLMSRSYVLQSVGKYPYWLESGVAGSVATTPRGFFSNSAFGAEYGTSINGSGANLMDVNEMTSSKKCDCGALPLLAAVRVSLFN